MSSTANMATNNENAYWLRRDLRSDMELDLHRKMTAAEKETYGNCEASSKRQDRLYRVLAQKYNVVFIEYPDRKDYVF